MNNNTVGSVKYDASIDLASLRKSISEGNKLVSKSYADQAKAAKKSSSDITKVSGQDSKTRTDQVRREAEATAAAISKYSPQIQRQYLAVERANNSVTNATVRAQSAIRRYGADSTQATSATSALSVAVQNHSQAQSKLSTMMNNSSSGTSRFSSAMSKAGAVAGVVAGVVGTVLNSAISTLTSTIGGAVRRIDTLNNSSRTFENMGISGDAARKAMAALEKSINGLPTPLDSAVRGMTALTATYGDVNKGQKVFSALNNAILGFGGTAASVDNAILQLSQLPMDGPLDAQTWNSLRNSGLTPVLVAMAKESKMSVSQMKEAFGDGELKVQDFIDRLIKMDKEGGGGLKSLEQIAQDSTKGIGTGFTNMQTAITRGMAAIIEVLGSGALVGGMAKFGKSVESALKVTAGFLKLLTRGDFDPKLFKGVLQEDSAIVGFFLTLNKALEKTSKALVALKNNEAVLYAIGGAIAAIALVSIKLLIGALAALAAPIAAAAVAFAPLIAVGAALGLVALVVKKNWSTIKPIIDNVRTAFGQFYNYVREKAQPVIDTFKRDILPVLKELAILLKGQLVSAWTTFKDAMVKLWAVIAPYKPELIALAKIIGVSLVVALALVAAGMIAAALAVGIVVAAVATLIGWLAQLIAWFARVQTTASNAFWGMVGSMIGAFNNGVSVVQNFIHSVNARLQGLVIDMYRMGSNIIQGLWSGIRSGVTGLMGEVNRIADRIKETFANAMKIRSPSRVFMGFGENISKGLAMGISNGIGDATAAVNGMATDMQVTAPGSSISTGSYVPREQTTSTGSSTNVTVNLSMNGIMTSSKADERAVANRMAKLINETVRAKTGSTAIQGV